jgi:hypothetical protein
LRPAHHLIDAGVEIGVSGARKQGVIEHPAETVDAEAQSDAALLAALAGGIGVLWVAGGFHRPTE